MGGLSLPMTLVVAALELAGAVLIVGALVVLHGWAGACLAVGALLLLGAVVIERRAEVAP
jgi:hypothetical protein